MTESTDMHESTEATEAPQTREASATPESPAAAPTGPITGPRAAAAILFLMAGARLLAGQAFYIEAGFAVALLMTERDARIRWVRIVLLLFVGYGLFLIGQATLQSGNWLRAVSPLLSIGAVGALPFIGDDVPKVGVVFAIGVAGQIGVTLL